MNSATKISHSYLLLMIVSVILVLLSSCAEEGIIEESPRIIIPQSQEIITTTLYGRVIDDLGQPISNATVTYRSGRQPLQIDTDEQGYFLIKNIQNKGAAAYITISYPGKFDAFRKFSVLPDRYNYTEVEMSDRTIIGVIDAATGGSLDQSDGAKISLPAGGIVNRSGQPYTGTVEVAMTWIDPAAPNLSARIIGDLSGIDENNNPRALASFGMLQVELIDQNGNLLNIAANREAELQFPVPSSMMADAPSTIPLWSYDENYGTWIQEGVANLEGDKYIAKVTHFSAWNVDIMEDPIEITGQVKWNVEDGSVGGSYLKIYVCAESFGRKGGWLSSDGAFRFYNFPKDEKFKLKVYDQCENEIFVETFGPYSEDTHLGIIEVSLNNNIVKIIGNALDCNGNAVSNASLSMIQEGRQLSFPVDTNGFFEFSIDLCDDNSALLQIVDLDNILTKMEEINPMSMTVELFDLIICDELNDFIAITIDSDPEILLTPNVLIGFEDLQGDSINQEVVYIKYSKEDTSGYQSFELLFKAPTQVPQSVGYIGLVFSTDKGVCYTEGTGLEVTILQYGNAPGDIVSGTYSGTVMCKDRGSNDVTIRNINGSFKVPVR